MNYKVEVLPSFEREAKRLYKKYHSIRKNLSELVTSLKDDPLQGTPLGNGFYKVRMAISSKGKGKSGGARVITLVRIVSHTVYLAAIYDKSDRASISDSELKFIAKQLK
ncbi:MAG TPA: type II toxin-antitoxin system RelE/ParE family toxin [Bacteroidia bacterium]|jgi:mRNA-degrading endonuclease RelE of RelBE toxin-antitoxin system|nr:type II toxin-antitoxin system RelE/ParE family toxin [Bacteroidia bacterium]